MREILERLRKLERWVRGLLSRVRALELGVDVQSIVAGTNVTVNNADPSNPIVSAAGGTSGTSGAAGTSGTSGTVASSYLVYTALLTQSGTNAPVATVLENTLGGDLVWTYSDVGSYVGTLIGVFIVNKVWPLCAGNFGNANVDVKMKRSSNNTVLLETLNSGNPEDGLLNKLPIKIEVYP